MFRHQIKASPSCDGISLILTTVFFSVCFPPCCVYLCRLIMHSTVINTPRFLGRGGQLIFVNGKAYCSPLHQQRTHNRKKKKYEKTTFRLILRVCQQKSALNMEFNHGIHQQQCCARAQLL